jgi:hypothetical protein
MALCFPVHTATVPEAAYLVLCALLDTRHGDVALTAASAVHRLLPVVMGTTSAGSGGQGSKRAAGQDNSARRAASVQFVLSVYRCVRVQSWHSIHQLHASEDVACQLHKV